MLWPTSASTLELLLKTSEKRTCEKSASNEFGQRKTTGCFPSRFSLKILVFSVRGEHIHTHTYVYTYASTYVMHARVWGKQVRRKHHHNSRLAWFLYSRTNVFRTKSTCCSLGNSFVSRRFAIIIILCRPDRGFFVLDPKGKNPTLCVIECVRNSSRSSLSHLVRRILEWGRLSCVSLVRS